MQNLRILPKLLGLLFILPLSHLQINAQEVPIDTMQVVWDSLPEVKNGGFDVYYKQGETLFGMSQKEEALSSTDRPFKNYSGVFKSTDNGETWTMILGDSVTCFAATDKQAFFYTGGITMQRWSSLRTEGNYKFYKMDLDGNITKVGEHDVFGGSGNVYVPHWDRWEVGSKYYFFGDYQIFNDEIVSLDLDSEYWYRTPISSSGPSGNIAWLRDDRAENFNFISYDGGDTWGTIDEGGIPIFRDTTIIGYYRNYKSKNSYSSSDDFRYGVFFPSTFELAKTFNYYNFVNGCVTYFEREHATNTHFQYISCDEGESWEKKPITSDLYDATDRNAYQNTLFLSYRDGFYEQDHTTQALEFEKIKSPFEGFVNYISHFSIQQNEIIACSNNELLLRSSVEEINWNVFKISGKPDPFVHFKFRDQQLNAFTQDGFWYVLENNEWVLKEATPVSYTHLTLPTTPYV